MEQDLKTLFLRNASRPTRLICLGLTFFIGLCLTSLLASAVPGDTRAALLFQSAAQSVVAFILPAWISFRLFYDAPQKQLGLSRGYTATDLMLTLATMVCAVPLLNEIILLNESAAFPADIQAAFRQWEETASAYTDRMLNTTSVGGMLSGVLVVGILTGTAEEVFFRGALQKMLLGNDVNRHGAIWIAALVFSIMHFQPYGFIPRLLLGAFFGYLYTWSGSIWLSATAHAFNNSIVVVLTWLTHRGADISFYENCGTPESGTLWLAFLSLAATVALLFVCHKAIPSNRLLSN